MTVTCRRFRSLGGTNADDEYNMFKSGKVAMYSNGEWQLPNAIADVPFNWDIVTLPKNPTTGMSRSTVHAVAYAASANTANPDLAANLIQYLASDEGEKFFAEAGGVPPADPAPELLQMWKDSFGDTDRQHSGVHRRAGQLAGRDHVRRSGRSDDRDDHQIFDLGMSVEDATTASL